MTSGVLSSLRAEPWMGLCVTVGVCGCMLGCGSVCACV